jgi:23S rRNA (cytidine2498-2'-O)-methyltransferase
MDLLLSDAVDEAHLRAELRRCAPGSRIEAVSPGLLAVHGLRATELQPPIVFARQILPHATFESAASIRGWAELLLDRVAPAWPGVSPWRLHLAPRYGQGQAGIHRCALIRQALIEELGKKRRSLKRTLSDADGTYRPDEALVQLLLTSPETGFLSIVVAPQPHVLRHRLAPYPFGEIPVASDKSAPSRAFAKLVEAERRLGCRIEADETCVDLGACPGSWSYVALHRGARVTAVDRSPLREDLMAHPQLTFVRGDAFRFEPPSTVDWLLCDVIAAPERNIGLVLDWLKRSWCRRFVVTIKFKGADDYARLDLLKAGLPGLTESFLLTRLCANHNEACVAGTARIP